MNEDEKTYVKETVTDSLKDFEVYRKFFNKKQMDEIPWKTNIVNECNVCGFATNFEEICKRHQQRHQLMDLQNSGFNLSKENFTLPF